MAFVRLFEFLHHLCVFLITFRITRASELPDGETLFYHLNVLVILMAFNECAVHLYVIIIEKKKVVIHLSRFHYCLMCFGALTGTSYDFFKVCTHMIFTQTRFRMIIVHFEQINYNSFEYFCLL